MLVFKLTGAALLIAAGCGTGRFLCVAERRRLTQTDGFIALLRFIRAKIDIYLLPIDKILSGCDSSILSACGAVPADSFEKLLDGCEFYTGPGVRELLYKFAGELGKSNRTAQLGHCDYYIGRLSAERDRMDSELPRRCRLYMTLSLCAAAVVALLLF